MQVRPGMMQALTLEALSSDFSGCAVRVVPKPAPGPGEVLVRVLAASLGFPDLLITQGAYQHKPALPVILGGDIAGEIAGVGPGVEGVAIGDRVTAAGLFGGFAEFAVRPAAHVRLAPPGLGLSEAAAVSSAYTTAFVGLVQRGGLQAGEWVLVHGAAGGVGLAAVDLAHALGARVIATASTAAKRDQVAALHPGTTLLDPAAGFKDEVKALTQGGADLIYDPVGGGVFDESLRCVAFGGRVLVVGFASGRIPALGANVPLIKGFSLIGLRAGEHSRRFPRRGEEAREEIWRMVADARLRPQVHSVLPLARWREGFRAMQSREIVGRLIFAPSGP